MHQARVVGEIRFPKVQWKFSEMTKLIATDLLFASMWVAPAIHGVFKVLGLKG